MNTNVYWTFIENVLIGKELWLDSCRTFQTFSKILPRFSPDSYSVIIPGLHNFLCACVETTKLDDVSDYL